MTPAIERRYRQVTITIASGAALSNVIDFRPYAGAILDMPAAWSTGSIAFYHSATMDGTYQPLYDDTNALIEVSAEAGRSYVLPDKLFACAFIKVWSETGGSNVNQAASRDLTLSLKG